MNPLTDKVTYIQRPDGSTLEVIQPGAKAREDAASQNWLYSREMFDRYRPYLETGIAHMESQPEGEIAFDVPAGTSANTFCSRFRSARKALMMFHYDQPLLTRLLSLPHEPIIAMDPDGKRVWFRPKGLTGRMRKNPLAPPTPHTRTMVGVPAPSAMPDEPSLRALCLLISNKTVHGPFVFLGRVDPTLQDELMNSQDVAFAFDDKAGTTTLL